LSLWGQIKQRRVTQIVLAYLAAGWMTLAVVDQVVDREVLPGVVYRVSLTLYLFGIAFALILGWFHGEKGHQKAPLLEILLLTLFGIGALGTSASLVRSHLRDVTVASALETSTRDLRRVAVLYFEDESADGSMAVVADGLTDGLISALTEVRELDVVSRNGSESVRDLDIPPDSIATIFDAGTLMAGSVGQAGEDIQVTVRLIDGQSGTEIQRDRYTWPAEALASVSDELAREISQSLRELLGQEIRVREGRSRAPSTAAWLQVARAEKALKDGLAALRRGDDEMAARELASADQELARAQEITTGWVAPMVLRGRVSYESYALANTLEELVASLEGAMDFADQALALEPDHAAALELRGTARYRLWLMQLEEDEDALERQLAQAQADLERSLSLDRGRAEASSVLSHLYYQVDDWQKAVLAARDAYEQDAFLSAARGVLRRLYLASYDLGQYREARDWCLEGYRRFPDDFRFVQCQLYVLTMNGAEPDIDEAWALRDRLVSLLPEGQVELFSGLAQTFVAGVIGRAGLADSAIAVMDRARLAEGVDPAGDQIFMEAAMRSLMGDVDGAIDALQRYMIISPGSYPGDHWWWRNLAGHPDFERLQTVH
jgi:TolB-like protein